jgi:hypothetical protein
VGSSWSGKHAVYGSRSEGRGQREVTATRPKPSCVVRSHGRSRPRIHAHCLFGIEVRRRQLERLSVLSAEGTGDEALAHVAGPRAIPASCARRHARLYSAAPVCCPGSSPLRMRAPGSPFVGIPTSTGHSHLFERAAVSRHISRTVHHWRRRPTTTVGGRLQRAAAMAHTRARRRTHRQLFPRDLAVKSKAGTRWGAQRALADPSPGRKES